MIGERECSRELIAVDGRPIMNSLPEPSPLPDPSMTTNFDVDPSYVAPLGSKVHGRGAPHLVEEEEDGGEGEEGSELPDAVLYNRPTPPTCRFAPRFPPRLLQFLSPWS